MGSQADDPQRRHSPYSYRRPSKRTEPKSEGVVSAASQRGQRKGALTYRNVGCGGLYWTVNPARRPSIPNVWMVAYRVV